MPPVKHHKTILTKAGSHTNIGISKTISQKISTRGDPCREDIGSQSDDSEYYKLTSEILPYNKILCREIYIQTELIIPNCGCLGKLNSIFL